MQVYSDNTLPILCWAKDLEESAMEQARNLAEHPCVYNRVCIMPDGHCGYGMPIGGVIATKDAVIPNAVGVDIGCSMSAGRTNILTNNISEECLQNIVKDIARAIPTGTNHHKEPQVHSIFDDKSRWDNCLICSQEYESARYQLGTMGGGNHFVELQVDTDGHLWYMIHSGSRNLGYKVGHYYNKLAEQLCATWKHDKVVANQLAFFPRGTKEFDAYWDEMSLCLDFAKANHDVMVDKIQEILSRNIPELNIEETFYTRHNYAAIESHDGINVIVHRKGAIRAREKDMQIIPGSQGTASYIVKGLGNPRSFCSASHGSGRAMSRTKAQETLSLEHEIERMTGIIHNITSTKQLDEAPSAYKDIEEVIALEADLVTPCYKLTPIAVMKG